jgi:ribosomal protein S18 acetylase RimI-like enzyme
MSEVPPSPGRRAAMAITYYKRFRMEIDVEGSPTPSALPRPFVWVGWEESLLEQHAEVKFLAFHEEIDAHVFPCLGERQGCQRLMREIRRKPGFLPSATWLIRGPLGYIGSIQGVIDRGPIGAIQNVGVAPPFRGQGFGRALVHRALVGFREAGVRRVYLEVTAENSQAVRLYRELGFRRAKTLYKAVDG